MRNTRWLRYGLASTIAAFAGMGVMLAACGDDDDSGPGNPDTGTNTETGTPDGSGTDASKEAAVDAGSPAKLTLINATTDMGPNAYIGSPQTAAIRVCFKQGTTEQNLGVAPYPPLPDTAPTKALPGIFYGTGGTFPSFGLDLEPRIIVPIVMNAKSLAAKGILNPGNGSGGTSCDEIVGSNADAATGLEANKDYWELPAIPAGTFKKEKAYVLLLTGCVADADPANTFGGVKCGAGFTPDAAGGLGNLKVTILETTRTPVSATSQGLQFAHASAQADAVFNTISSLYRPGVVANPADGGGYQSFTDGGAPEYLKLTPAASFAVKDSDYIAAGPTAGPTNPAAPESAFIPFPLPAIQALSGLGAPTAPTVYTAGHNYVVVAVGDPDPNTPRYIKADGTAGDAGEADTAFNTRFFHFLAFPTDPAVVGYKP